MRTFIIILTCILGFLLFFNGCIVNIVSDFTAPATAAADDPSVIKLVSLALLAVYEVVVRLVPSIGDYSAVSWIIRMLKKMSDTLNIRI
jgi:hypothetical protein